MIWFLAIVMVLVIGAIAVVAAGAGGAMQPVQPDRPDATVPADGMLTPEDLRSVRFSVGVRGYRMDEVDTLLERIADELARRDALPPPPSDPGGSGARADERSES